MNNKQEYRMGVGASSILMIFVILSLTTLGVLSFASAKVEDATTTRRQKQVESYYAAVADVQRKLFEIDQKLLEAPEDVTEFMDYVRALEDERTAVSRRLLLSFSVPMNENQALDVAIQVLMPGNPARYTLERHRVVNTTEWVADNLIFGGNLTTAVPDASTETEDEGDVINF